MKKSRYDTPPGYALRFLEWFCPPALYEGIEGDLAEQFEADKIISGATAARRKFIWHVLRFFRPGIILRNQFSTDLINTIMVANYIKVASRNLAKRKLYSFINAFGLSIGIAFCMLIYLFIQDEWSFDQFHENKNRIYRLDEKSYDTWQHDPAKPYNYSAYLPIPLREAVETEIPEIEYSTFFNSGWNGAFQYEDKVFTEPFTFISADFFKMFSFPLIEGNRDKLFATKEEIVITPAIAKKYFGDESPLGKVITLFIDKEKSLTVTGVIEAPPGNSSLDYKMLVPMENYPNWERRKSNWGNFGHPIFIQLSRNANADLLGRKFPAVIEKHMGEKLKEWSKDANVPEGVNIFELEYTALPDIHLKTKVGWDRVSDPKYSFILGSIALLILIIACINYVSLALTTSTSRRVEVGIRKVVGAQRSQLVYQFGFESVILAFISMTIAIGLVMLFLPYFNEFTNKTIALSATRLMQFGSVGLAITVFVGLLAGSYPSFFLSRFKPALVLKGRFTSKLQAGFTKPLVVIQFVLSAFLIISSVIMYRQMRFITTKDLGYNKDQILVIPTQAGWTEASDNVVAQFRQRLSKEPNVISVAGTTTSFNQGYSRYGYKIGDKQKSAYVYGVDPEYATTLGLTFLQGRNFDPATASDTLALVVNEALVKDMGWTDPLNEHLNWTEDSLGAGYKVIGVVKDYHFLSLEKSIEPLFMSINKKSVGNLTAMLVKIKPGEIPSTLERLQVAWKELYPNKPFDYSFLDEDVAKQYRSHERWAKIMGLSTGFAILIACLGLFGLSGISAINRTKEIGIRKVMGANLSNIFILLNRQYVGLSIIAFAIAAPLSWYIMGKWWLADFQFKIALGWELFAVSMLAGLLVALITVSYHSIKAALVNPAETLKYE